MPTQNVRWKVEFAGDVAVLGLGFADDGKVLLLSTSRRGPVGHGIESKLRGIIGLSTQTGEQLFDTPLPQELLEEKVSVDSTNASLSLDGTTLLLNYLVPGDTRENTYSHLLLYDWRKQQIIMRYRTPTDNATLDKPTHRSSTLAVMSKHAVHRLMLWQDREQEPMVLPISDRDFEFGLSDDGEMAHVCTVEANPYQLVLIDVKKRTKVQTIDGVFREVHWSADHQSFLALKFDPQTQQSVFWRYRRIEGRYVADQKCEIAIEHPYYQSLRNRPFITVRTFTQFDPWRTKLEDWLGTRWKFIIDRFWPGGPIVQLHDVQTGRLMHRFQYPLQVFGKPFPYPGVPFPHPDGYSMALCGDSTVLLWDLYPFSRHYHLLGLLIGLLCSTLLAWKLLRRSPRTSKVPATA